MSNPAVNEIQAAYIRKVVDTVNDLDNVLYEVINEGGEQKWDWWVVETVREVPADQTQTAPDRHHRPRRGGRGEHVGQSGRLDLAGPQDGYGDDPPAWDGKKVSLLDTDHVWGVGGNGAWVWKSLLRGHNPLFMDPYDGLVLGKPLRSAVGTDPPQPGLRAAPGQPFGPGGHVPARRTRVHDVIAWRTRATPTWSTFPTGGKVKVVARGRPGRFAVEWIHPSTGKAVAGRAGHGGADREFTAPFDGDAVLYLSRS